jgi:hypothetical protein
MKRFLKTLGLLVLSLFLLVSGVDAGLDHLSRSATQSSFTLYNEKGDAIASYTGDLHVSKPVVKWGGISEIHIFHRS